MNHLFRLKNVRYSSEMMLFTFKYQESVPFETQHTIIIRSISKYWWQCGCGQFTGKHQINFTNVIRRYFKTGFCLYNYYEVLGITPKATQKQIKEAYYRLSKLHHPDKNKGEAGASEKFRKLTEAYEVLGNLRLRRLYNKGLLHTSDDDKESPFTGNDDAPFNMGYTSRPPPTGRTSFYDYDAWTRMHYRETFHRKQRNKAEMENKKVNKMESSDILYFNCLVITALFLCIMVTLTLDTQSHNQFIKKNNKKENKSND